MVHSKRMPEWVSAHPIPGVWRLGRRDEADTPGLPVLMRDLWPARAEIAKGFGRGSSPGLRQRRRGEARVGRIVNGIPNSGPGASLWHAQGRAGVLEIVDDFDGDTYRAVYTGRFRGVVYVLHAFQKKSRRALLTHRAALSD